MTLDAPFTRIQHLSAQVAPSLLPTCKLVLYVQPHQVLYVLISPDEKLIACYECKNSQGISSDMFLRFVFERETLLRKPFLSCQVYTSEPLFSLIPEAHYRQEEAHSLARLLLDGAVFPEDVFSVRVPPLHIRVLFAVSPPLLHLLNHYVSSYTIHHICEVSLHLGRHLANSPSSLILHLQKDHIMITAFREGKLSLCNVYPFRSIPDALYFVQVGRRVSGLEHPDIPVFVLGDIGERGKQQNDLWEYLPDMQIPQQFLEVSSEDMTHTAYWRYAFLAVDE
ncbi:MAG: DUF3822 family protein [Bacteroidota bacterium]